MNSQEAFIATHYSHIADFQQQSVRELQREMIRSTGKSISNSLRIRISRIEHAIVEMFHSLQKHHWL